MEGYFCPIHTQTRLVCMLAGAVGYCSICLLYTRAAGVPEPKPVKATGKAQKARKKGKAKVR